MKIKIFIGFILLLASVQFMPQYAFADDSSQEALLEKINQVLTNQETILSQIQELKSELEVIKVRTTR